MPNLLCTFKGELGVSESAVLTSVELVGKVEHSTLNSPRLYFIGGLYRALLSTLLHLITP